MGSSVTSTAEAVIKKFEQKTCQGSSPAVGDAHHFVISSAWIQDTTDADGVPPVSTMGSVYRYSHNTNIWYPNKHERVALDVGRRYRGKNCKKAADYRQIEGLVDTQLEYEDFFCEAPGGIAAGGLFWRVTLEGEIISEELTEKHRQRMRLNIAPDFESEPSNLLMLLDNAFGAGDSGDAQRELLQMALGAALIGTLWKYRTAIMLFGATSTGKSTILDILRTLFPSDRIGATSPHLWNNEYHLAALAGRTLNIVGELEPTMPVAGGAFKAITGGDVVEGRHPAGRPFSFVCTAAHIFNCNHLPPTRDKSDAFFRRWRILEFSNPVRPGDEIIGLADQISKDEQAAVLAWLLNGAARLPRRGSLPETGNHRRLIRYWRAANNSALQFLLDTDCVEVGKKYQTRGTEAFIAYRKWASATGVSPFGRNKFYEALAEGVGRLGIDIADDRNGVKTIRGARIIL